MQYETQCVMAVQGHPRSLILVLNGKHVCNFLLVINSKLGPILLRFRDRSIAGFLLKQRPSTLFNPNFWGVSLGLDGRRSEDEKRNRKLIIHVITFEVIQLYDHKSPTSQTDRETIDERTEGQLTIAKLRASRGNELGMINSR